MVSEERARALGTLSDQADQLRLSWHAFETEPRRLWPTRVDTFFDDACPDRFLRRLWTESPGYAGTEIIRCIIGFAHLTDPTPLPGPVMPPGAPCCWDANRSCAARSWRTWQPYANSSLG